MTGNLTKLPNKGNITKKWQSQSSTEVCVTPTPAYRLPTLSFGFTRMPPPKSSGGSVIGDEVITGEKTVAQEGNDFFGRKCKEVIATWRNVC